MSRIKNIKLLGLILAIAVIILGILPVIKGNPLTNDAIATAIIFVLLGIAYIIINFNFIF